MKRYYIITILISLLVLAGFGYHYRIWESSPADKVLKVGFLYENDDATPYAYNFTLARKAMAKAFGDKVVIYSKTNVQENQTEEPLRELIRSGCRIIFCNTNSSQVQLLAPEYPDVQFCQVSTFERDEEAVDSPNFHTFNAKTYQGRYVSGIVAGMKLRELLDEGVITPDQALIGYIGAFPTAEIISGYTAFLLGARSVAPEAVMLVSYTRSWHNYSLEKAYAQKLIGEGCVIISQHSGTVGVAVACEEASEDHLVYHIGFNQSMRDVAPKASLISARANWTPYLIESVTAVMNNKPIEKVVKGDVHGTDISAGFDHGWVEMLDLNKKYAAPGTDKAIAAAVDGIKKNSISVFKGDYLGVDPDDETKTYDLNNGFIENAESSIPTFRYILQDVIRVMKED